MCVYFRNKFPVSSIILLSLRQQSSFIPPFLAPRSRPPPQRKTNPLKAQN